MSDERIRSAIERASDHLRDHPEDAVATDSSARAVLVDGLVVRVSGPNGESLLTDMVPSVGGTGAAPSPGWLLRAAWAVTGGPLVDAGAAALARLVPTWPQAGPPLPGVVIDHIVTSPQVPTHGYSVVPVAGSDHAAVLATLTVPAGG